MEIRRDDLSSAATRQLLRLHLAGMHANSPPGHVFALDLSGLQAPGVTVWSAWKGKSMRTHPDHLRQGVGAAILEHIIREARARGFRRLSLETGRGPAFEPALALYRRRGFVDGGAFADYVGSPFNQFLHLVLGNWGMIRNSVKRFSLATNA
jgi:putative acetyltransferase